MPKNTLTSTRQDEGTPEAATDHPAVPAVIRAHSFELVDKDSNARAQFGFGDDTGELAQLVLLDPSGEPRVGMTCDGNGAGVGLLGKNGLRMVLMSGYTDEGNDASVALELFDAKGESQFSVMVSETGAVTMAGWAGWANERLQKADVAGDALRLLASEVSGFMRPGDRVVNEEDDEVMQKLAAAMHEAGREERSAFIQECSEADTRLAAVEAQAVRIEGLMGEIRQLVGKVVRTHHKFPTGPT